MNHTELGIYGERLAEQYLIQKGYRITDRNYRFGKLEIDLVTQKDEKLVIVEVKTRHTAEIGEPWLAVTKTKQRQIIRTADHYIKAKNIDLDAQFDIISIVHNSYRTAIEHIENAFGPSLL